MFERIYVCLQVCKAGFAIGRDGNNQIFPIVYVVVKAETKDFANLLIEDLQDINHRPYAFMVDQQGVACYSVFL